MPYLKHADLAAFLREMTDRYNRPEFINTDPISIPHRFRKREDIEIAGFLAATIAWGQRPVILRNAAELLRRMDNDPHQFILSFSESDLRPLRTFVHRTFNGDDCVYFIKALGRIYRTYGSPEKIIHEKTGAEHSDLLNGINHWRKLFFRGKHLPRTEKHFADPSAGSASKRLNMFLRWMIRKDSHGVDFGIWKNISPSLLTCPLDVHSARVARKLGLLRRKQNDWAAAKELTNNLRKFDPSDPVKYDFALFGLGVFEKF